MPRAESDPSSSTLPHQTSHSRSLVLPRHFTSPLSFILSSGHGLPILMVPYETAKLSGHANQDRDQVNPTMVRSQEQAFVFFNMHPSQVRVPTMLLLYHSQFLWIWAQGV